MNPYSFQSVLDHTKTEDGGLRIPGSLMPAGRAVFAKTGGKMDAGVANQWHEVVRKEYERQESEIAEAHSSPAPPQATGGREDGASAGHEGGKGSAQVAGEMLEAQLEATVRACEESLVRIDADLDRLSVARRETDERLQRARRALRAYQDDS